MTVVDDDPYVQWWRSGVERIAEAFYQLPSAKPEHEMSIPVFREMWGHHFMNMYRGPRTDDRRIRRRQKEPASLKTTTLEIEETLACTRRLIECLEKMHSPAIAAIGGAVAHDQFRTTLQHLQVFLEYPTIPDIDEGVGRGRPADNYALNVAIEVGRLYRYITERHPTITRPTEGGKATGKFMNVLTEVFTVLGIEDSPEGRGAAAIKAIERMPPKISD